MSDRFSPRFCLGILVGGVVLSWLAAFVALALIHVLGRWAAELLGWV
ncbi:hypothetical protein [Elioraea sp.]|jgi:hypothetical protein|nr:hypothetical protein [Elioraea sp.]GIX11599.1 MAG: hypothetical protein KatS3mg116_3309 [Elioraea sp.]